mmetsp:Transcript_103974/g.195718  ORF Transcript_103974/g.195718 Transcript_103974/m.195718 type:complete len:85 (-) Transcript_103974:55-309(-)
MLLEELPIVDEGPKVNELVLLIEWKFALSRRSTSLDEEKTSEDLTESRPGDLPGDRPGVRPDGYPADESLEGPESSPTAAFVWE